MNLSDKRIAVLLSGGVDSSVVLYELVRQGLKPDCFYIKIGSTPEATKEGEPEWDCSMEEDLEMATAVSHKYGCKLEVVDCHKDYWEQVTSYTINKVRAGMTPNPDVMCNRLIKFGAFHEKRGHEYDLIATGHYATTELDHGDGSDDPCRKATVITQNRPRNLQKLAFVLKNSRFFIFLGLKCCYFHKNNYLCGLIRANYYEQTILQTYYRSLAAVGCPG